MYQHNCKLCFNKKKRDYYHKHHSNSTFKKKKQNTHLTGHLRRNYGITREDYDAMVESQNGTCYVCHQDNGERRLHVDHNHTTGEVRKLLCSPCNTALGMSKENKNILQKLIDYINEHS